MSAKAFLECGEVIQRKDTHVRGEKESNDVPV